jgi:predicted TIM-barrel fold metal-dependent hydrolase
MERRRFLGAMLAGGSLAGWRIPDRVSAQPARGTAGSSAAARRGSIIDVHVHAYPSDEAIPELANTANGRPPGVKTGAAHRDACLAEMRRLGIATAVVSGGSGDRLAAAAQWHEADPKRVVPAAGVRGSADIPLPPVETLRQAFAAGHLRVLGEVTAQYAGLTLSDPIYEPYLQMAVDLDVPVAVHMGVGPPEIAQDPCCRGFRAALGNPLVLEEALVRHPLLRLNLMHGGWPYLQETIALLMMYPEVYTDVGAINWLLPRAEFHAYLRALVRAGFGRRILFGSDQMYWPEAIGMSIEAIESAAFLTAAERRDIFHDNAARFLRLDAR